ncbi:MAG: prolyl oligopeptidase family serine peptidase [Pirellulales bacterium]|nr:prolyl oligopeptidase family serine peptidase [Pirellulales bacterium]
MNRLPSVSGSLGSASPWQQGESATARQRSWRRPVERLDEDGLSFFTPMHYERNYAYPLFVWLHDDDGNERQIRQVMPHVSLRNYVAVAVRGTQTSRREKHGFVWRESADAVHKAAQQVRAGVEEARERFHVHADRVFIAGHRRGGTMALRLALRFPEWFAGAASLCGAMPQGDAPLARVKAARRLPLLLVSTRQSDRYPESQVVADLRLLHAAGFELSLRQYPGDCELDTEMLADVDRWVMERVCSPAPSEAR